MSIQYGYNAPAIERGDIKMVRISDIHDNVVQWSTVPFCKITPSEIDTYRLKENDILFARTGGTVGKSFLVQSVPEPAIYAGYLIRTRYSQELCPQYLKSFMESQLYWEQLKSGTIATAQPNCNGKTLGRMLLPIPPKAEQSRLVQKIETLSPLFLRYAKAQLELDNLNEGINETLKKSILQEAIQGKLVPQDPNDEPASVLLERIREEKLRLLKEGKLKKKDITDSVIFKGEDNKYYERLGKSILCIDEDIPFEIPETWAWARMGMLVKLIGGTSYQKGDINASGIRILRGGNIQNDQLVFCDDDVFLPSTYAESEKNIHAGDIIIVASTGSPTVIGKPALISESIPNTQIGAFLRIVRPLMNALYPYVQLIFTTEFYREHIRSKAKGTNINNIKAEYIEGMLIPVPPLAEQQRIILKSSEVVSSIMSR